MEKIIMVDFDGTISKRDTCVATLHEFATRDWKFIEDKWAAGELTTRDSSIELYRLMDIQEKKLEKFLRGIEIDDYFVDFIDFCNEKGYKIFIVSDGFDYNIKTILSKYSLDYLESYSNSFSFDEKGNYMLDFPYENKDCGKCGTCKTDIFTKLKTNSNEIIYIGDGYSDRCVSAKADMLFAKDYLAKYCDDESIEYIKYDNFQDIINTLKNI